MALLVTLKLFQSSNEKPNWGGQVYKYKTKVENHSMKIGSSGVENVSAYKKMAYNKHFSEQQKAIEL